MKNRQFTIDFVKAALIRATKTAAQVMLSMLTVGAAITSFDWTQILSITATSFVYSILTSVVFGIPEGEYQGALSVGLTTDEAGDSKPALNISFNIPGDQLVDRNNVNIKVLKED